MSPDKTYQEEALKVNGFTVEEIHDQRKKDLAELMADFYNWIPDKEKTIVIGQNVFFDKLFVDKAFKECGIDFKLHHRLIDLHSCVYFYAKKNNIDVDVKNISSDFIANLLGVPVEIKPHNALNGAKQNVLVYNKLFEV
jgi:DNA polymerase III epsilon subunit-like protein